MKAIVYKSTGSWYVAKSPDGRLWQCRIAGKMKIDEEITSTNPVAVGDFVELNVEDEILQAATIIEVKDRYNYIVRSSPHQKYERHIVAANIDQAMLVSTLREPRTSRGFIDRFLVMAAAYHIPVVLIFNKQDIYREKEMKNFDKIKSIYANIGYPVLLISALAKEQLNAVKEKLQNKTTLMAGHSGAGKSTLINGLIPDLELKTRPVSQWSGKGTHTTTFAEMHELPFGGKLIDTPGIREWGIVDVNKTELSHYFLDMQPYLQDCKFNNCLHLNEPGCAVKGAVSRGDINAERYGSYQTILHSLNEG